MHTKLAAMLAVIALISAPLAQARDDRDRMSVQDAMSSDEYTSRLSSDVKFYWGDTPHPAVAKKFGNFRSNKKTNAFRKTAKVACERALLSALLTLQQRALREGGNAVVNIKSNYKDVPFSSRSEYECGVGNVVAGVALTADIVKLH